MKFNVDIQIISEQADIPNRFLIQRWVNETLENRLDNAEVCIRVVDENEMRDLNFNYRKKVGPTNVLSFPFKKPDGVEFDANLLGDLVVCAPVITSEACEQNKNLEAHWAHIIIHGILHLLGYDHIKVEDAQVMENIEIKILDKLGHPNPYGEGQHP